jgi:hypothetical protein
MKIQRSSFLTVAIVICSDIENVCTSACSFTSITVVSVSVPQSTHNVFAAAESWLIPCRSEKTKPAGAKLSEGAVQGNEGDKATSGSSSCLRSVLKCTFLMGLITKRFKVRQLTIRRDVKKIYLLYT